MPDPQFGFSVTPGPASGVAREAVLAEGLGYDRIGIWDSPALFREPWVVLGAIAGLTHRAAIGTWVTNPQTRHPLVTASAAASVDDLAPGRAYIGIGSGGTGVWHAGHGTSSLDALGRYVTTVRRLLEDGEADYDGATVILPWVRRRIPIIVAAHGPRALRLAGRIGDGVIVGLGITPEVVAASLELIDEGARESGRRVDDLDVWFTCFWFVDPEPGVARRQACGPQPRLPPTSRGRGWPASSCLPSTRTGSSSLGAATTTGYTALCRISRRTPTRLWLATWESASTSSVASCSVGRLTRSNDRSAQPWALAPRVSTVRSTRICRHTRTASRAGLASSSLVSGERCHRMSDPMITGDPAIPPTIVVGERRASHARRNRLDRSLDR